MGETIFNLILLPFIVFVLVIAGCAVPKPKDLPPTGTVKVIVEKEVVDKKTGSILLQVERLEELAERSIMDKGAEALLTPQRYATMGESYFSSYSVSSNNKIVASIYNRNGKDGSDIWIFSGGKIRLTKTNYFNNDPSFSADTKNVYFVSSRGKSRFQKYDQNSYVWRMPSYTTGGLTRIGSPAYKFLSPKESPDGRKILFCSREFSQNSPFIWYMKDNGALPTQLKQGIHANWLDNDKIIFSTQDENTDLYSIWTCMVDGSNLTQIITDNEMDCLFPSADKSGQYIAYVKQLPNTNKIEEWQSRDIYIFHLKDGLSQQITTNISRDDLPEWSNDGKYLYFRSSRGLSWNIWRVPTAFLNRE